MYLNKGFMAKPCGTSAVTEEVLTSAAVIQRYVLGENCFVDEIGIVVTTIVSSSGSVVVDFKAAAYPGASATMFAQLTLTSTQALGSVVVKRITPKQFTKGMELSVAVSTAASSTGKGVSFFSIQDDPETDANVSTITASA